MVQAQVLTIPTQVCQHNHIRCESRPSKGRRSCGEGAGELEEEGELSGDDFEEQPGAHGGHLQEGGLSKSRQQLAIKYDSHSRGSRCDALRSKSEGKGTLATATIARVVGEKCRASHTT
jgi:hypothetical protein